MVAPPECGREPASTVVQDPGFLGVVAADVGEILWGH